MSRYVEYSEGRVEKKVLALASTSSPDRLVVHSWSVRWDTIICMRLDETEFCGDRLNVRHRGESGR